MSQTEIVLENLKELIKGKGAHASLDDALENIPEKDRGTQPNGLPYSIWQLAEHIRIAQWDMLEFCKSSDHVSPHWPDDYWPKNATPGKEEWNKMTEQLREGQKEFLELLEQKDLYEKIPHGKGQTIFQEALQLADHNAYHTAEIIILRRLLKNWK